MRAGRLRVREPLPGVRTAGSSREDRRKDTVTTRSVPDGCMTRPGFTGCPHALETGQGVPVPGQGEAERSKGGSPYVSDEE